MVEETKLRLFQITQTIIGSLVVASLLGLAGSLVGLRDAVREHDLLISQFREFQQAGNRYTSKDGQIERDARMQADAVLGEKVDAMNANQVRMWTAIRNHIEQGQHQGADFRLKALEDKLNRK